MGMLTGPRIFIPARVWVFTCERPPQKKGHAPYSSMVWCWIDIHSNWVLIVYCISLLVYLFKE